MRFLVDANVICDYLRIREPFYDPARLLFLLGRIGEFELWLSPSQMGDLFYTLTEGGKKSKAEITRNQLRDIRKLFRVCAIGESEVDEALRSDWPDLEDAMVYQAARSIKADAIITRNQKDFAQSRIPVFDCDELFAWLRNEKGVNYDYITL